LDRIIWAILLTVKMEKLMDIFDKSFLTRWLNIILWKIWVKGVTKNRRKE